MQWSRVMRTGIGKWWSFAAATIKGGSCPSISWKPMSTSSNILCLSTFKTLPWKIFLREWSWKGCKSCQIHQVGRSAGWLVGWTWHSPQRSWRRWPRLMSTCCFSSWLVLTFKESNYRSRSFFRTRCSCLPSKYCFNNPLFKWVFLFSPLCFSAHVGSVQPISFWWATYLLWLVIFQTVLWRYFSAKANSMCWQSKYMKPSTSYLEALLLMLQCAKIFKTPISISLEIFVGF